MRIITLTICILFLLNSSLYCLPISSLRVPSIDWEERGLPLQIEWVGYADDKTKNTMSELLQLEDIEKLFLSNGNNKISVKMSPSENIYTGLDWQRQQSKYNFTLLIGINFADLDLKRQKIHLKHVGYQVKYFSPEVEKGQSDLMKEMESLFGKSEAEDAKIMKSAAVSHILYYIASTRKAIRGGNKNDAYEYVNLSLENVDSDITLYVQSYANIYMFSLAYLNYALPFISEGEEETGIKVKDRLKKSYSDKGYTQAEIDSGIELAESIMDKIEMGKAFLSLKSLTKLVSDINMLDILSTNL